MDLGRAVRIARFAMGRRAVLGLRAFRRRRGLPSYPRPPAVLPDRSSPKGTGISGPSSSREGERSQRLEAQVSQAPGQPCARTRFKSHDPHPCPLQLMDLRHDRRREMPALAGHTAHLHPRCPNWGNTIPPMEASYGVHELLLRVLMSSVGKNPRRTTLSSDPQEHPRRLLYVPSWFVA